MTTRPEAIRLAEELAAWEFSSSGLCGKAAAELRRLHNEILVYHDDRLKLSNEVDRLRAALGLIASLEQQPAKEKAPQSANCEAPGRINSDHARSADYKAADSVSLETVYETIICWDEGGGKRSRRELARRIVDLYTTPTAAPVQEPIGTLNIWFYKGHGNYDFDYWGSLGEGTYTVHVEKSEAPSHNSTCNETLRAQGKSYPRTCKKCGLGPCVGKPKPDTTSPAAPVQEPLEYWNAVEGWVKIDEVRQHFDSVGCGTIYKNAGEDRVPLYTAAQRQWVDLTNDEIALIHADNPHPQGFARAVLAKSKEKNG